MAPVVRFFWDLYPFKLFCWDLAYLLDIIFCPFCWFLWIPFQFFAVPFNIYFILFLPCNLIGIVFNITVFLIVLPPGFLITLFTRGTDGIILGAVIILFVASPGTFGFLYFWESLVKAYFNSYCASYGGYIGLSPYCTTISDVISRAAAFLTGLLSGSGGG